ncbi:FAD-dependent oxidoreductase [Paludicola sp. MB14-C6]|uniref:NAD(P)/FAD-dependent oxidoreductase n=1 Tax=Paludihabitans sp. MB14-C6 TaxID=3070656 RepID=UPI0027DD67FF|nr:FAD-dependent oxidoreductase [Paludicola sp. MB14-C6]WMJ24216.1 FAD-dependent oxidoreductase [Paludicola sp. MB14-C6]
MQCNCNEIKNTSLFADLNEVPCQYPWLSYNETCEVVVIGGGITGAFCLYDLNKCGIDAILVSQKPIGYSSSCVSSSALQYQNEIMLTELSKSVGKDQALYYFRQCNDALNEIEQLSIDLNNFDFARRDGFLYTDSADKIDKLHTEYLMRRHNGFDVEFLEKADARDYFSFDIQAGILAKNLAGEVDGYKLCHALVEKAEDLGARIYENTTIVSIENEDNEVVLTTSYGKTIHAKKVVMAIGYRQESYLSKEIFKKTSFSLATQPVSHFSGYQSRAILKNMDKNIHIRTTADNRIIISGLDCSLMNKQGRIGKVIGIDKLVERKYRELELLLDDMFVAIDDLQIAYRYDGQYPQSEDLLPFIGEYEDYPNILFAVPTSQNGILYAKIISKMIAESLCDAEEK